ncbi:uncharacterized protein BDW43DRAFT_296107 [Aspergillus alliaceus]|uniref:uncharacterized protein n=1 Tax=Petromyces alliaceus TaxID=209559 RepID=UPI0012A4141E|nr:uncharacterized protein BDW43DRAFT_296107 [Aspergillus alliaceus]KAB8239765.1 hypothetical protein BDW43DRAFT_296107 [Aspergillus alliaceus]
MAHKASEQEVCQSVLDFVTEGTYPTSENVIVAEFPASALAKELELLSKAREQVETEITALSQDNDFDADGWISQAKQLHADIERSRVTAREIVAQHENTNPLQLKVEDAAAKVQLIETEIAFNQAVTHTLEEVQRLCQRLDAGRAVLGEGRVMEAIKTLEATEQAIKKDNLFSNTSVMHVLLENVDELRREIAEYLRARWSEQLNVDGKGGSLTISNDNGHTLEETIAALVHLGMAASCQERFEKDLISTLFEPILLPAVEGYSRGIKMEQSSIRVESESSKASVSELLDRIATVLGFLRQHLPAAISDSFSGSLIPTLSSKVISCWLSSAIPTDLEGLDTFESTLNYVLKFANAIEMFGWHGHEELVSWVNQAPRLWLTRRRVDSLDRVRKVLAASQGVTKQVERVEKEEVSGKDEVLLDNTADDWDASWDDDNEHESTGKHSGNKEDEDVSAWGLDDDSEANITETKPDISVEDDAADAWGWGDEDEEENPQYSQTKSTNGDKSVNGKDSAHHASPREVTLKEQYTVTDIPDSILCIIQQQIKDSEAISKPVHSHSRVVSSGAGLLALPTLILAMFKATASSFYGLKLHSGQMYLYNDSLYLADKVRNLSEEHRLSRLHADIDALEKFGKFAYSKEMRTQRTIVTDLLDGAQGFNQCSEQPFRGECENAVSAVVDRIRDVYKEWEPILSHSALLQSVGSLVSTVINKIIIEVEDLGDISEAQSQQLVLFCNKVSELEDLFVPETTDEGARVPMTAVYVRDWLKFQYLINILESSLADIKFLWLEGELRLEFSPEEVVDLIEALFAESDYRRKAIAEIRRFKMSEELNSSSAAASAQRQVRVQLTSKQEDIALPENTGPILVPTGLRRYALSTLVNNLLGNDKPIPFEFLINGSFLRTSIDEYLTANGISAETTLEIEYVRALIPPLHIASFEHDDWVSSVDVLSTTSPAASWASAPIDQGQERILSGSYDGLLRIWDMSSQIVATSPSAAGGGHTASIKAAKFISPNSIMSAGLDRTVRLWKYSEDGDGFSGKLAPQLELYGHKGPVNSLAVYAPSSRVLSASSDHSVGLWSTKKSDAPAAPENLLPSAAMKSSKRRKLNSAVSTPQRGPLALLSSHSAPVSAAIFDSNDSTVGYSASWDHSLRTWDLVTASLVDTRTTAHSLLSLEHLPEHHLLAAGTSARHITLVDPRASATTIAAMTLRGHTNAVVSLARDPKSSYGLISGSHDGTCRIWDIRATKTDKDGVVGESVYSISRKSLEEQSKSEAKRVGGEGVKVFGVAWDGIVGIVSAGEDKRIQINRGEGVLSSV